MSTEDPAPNETAEQLRITRLEQQLREARADSKRLREELLRFSDLAESATAIQDFEVPTSLLPTGQPRGKARAIACWCFSDWHVEETVVAAQVNGLNSYSVDIAYRRIQKLVDGCLWHLRMHAEKYHLDGLLIHMGGDHMTGWIHKELMEIAAFTPIETSNWLFTVLVEMFNRIKVEVGKLGIPNIKVVWSPGNHGRATEKRRTANMAQTSYEWLVAQRLVHEFREDPLIKMWAPKSIWSYVQLYDFTYRLGHGDHLTGPFAGGGIGGILPPLFRGLARVDRGRRADVTVIGHWHQLQWADPIIVNGSLIGPTPYSLRFGHEEPQQAYWLVVDGRGRSAQTPIWVKDRHEPHTDRPQAPSDAQWDRTGWVKPPDFSSVL